MYESALQLTKFCVSKKGWDCVTWMEKSLLAAYKSFPTVEIPTHEEKNPGLHPK